MIPVNIQPAALTLDLDDTLWPIRPAIERAERALHGWLVTHSPQTALADWLEPLPNPETESA